MAAHDKICIQSNGIEGLTKNKPFSKECAFLRFIYKYDVERKLWSKVMLAIAQVARRKSFFGPAKSHSLRKKGLLLSLLF